VDADGRVGITRIAAYPQSAILARKDAHGARGKWER
jgi:hypothetical protein